MMPILSSGICTLPYCCSDSSCRRTLAVQAAAWPCIHMIHGFHYVGHWLVSCIMMLCLCVGMLARAGYQKLC